jgi:hypothetical protein
MPTAATTVGGTAQTRGRQGQSQVLPMVPFVRASAEHREPTGIDVTRTLSAADQDLGVFDIPAYGYVRSLLILVQATAGAGTSVTTAEDGPWTALKNIALTEPNGAVIDQYNTGFETMLANKWGGYRHPNGADPKASQIYSGPSTTTGNFQFFVRIPVELNLRDALGALPNQNAAATFKLRLTLAKMADIYGGTVPSTPPSVRVRVFLEAWDQPEVQSAGQSNQITPPAMNTTQFWSVQTFNINAGQQNVRLTRVGNYLRNLIMIYRTAAGVRSTQETQFPDPITLYLDTRPLDIVDRLSFKNQMYERTGFGATTGTATPANDTPNGMENGVYVYDFMHEFDGALGRENRDLWLPTLGSTRLEFQGSFGVAGTLTILTNDVAIAGTVFL